MAILLVGVELARGSIAKILRPEAVSFSAVSVVILLLSIAVKLWMCWFNRSLGSRLGSTAMKATAMDSLTDAVATSAVVLGIAVSYFAKLHIDGWIGMLVALFILYTGWTTARDSLSPLLGQAPDAAFVRQIEETVLAHDEVSGGARPHRARLRAGPADHLAARRDALQRGHFDHARRGGRHRAGAAAQVRLAT